MRRDVGRVGHAGVLGGGSSGGRRRGREEVVGVLGVGVVGGVHHLPHLLLLLLLPWEGPTVIIGFCKQRKRDKSMRIFNGRVTRKEIQAQRKRDRRREDI